MLQMTDFKQRVAVITKWSPEDALFLRATQTVTDNAEVRKQLSPAGSTKGMLCTRDRAVHRTEATRRQVSNHKGNATKSKDANNRDATNCAVT